MSVLFFILVWTALSLPIGILIGKMIAEPEEGETILRQRIALLRQQ